MFEKLKIDFDGSDDYTKTDYFIRTVKYDEKNSKIVMKGMLNSAKQLCKMLRLKVMSDPNWVELR